MDALNILKSQLIGNFYSRFSSGDSFEFRLDDSWLIAQNVVSKNESSFNTFLVKNYSSYSKAIDKELIAKNISLTALMRQEIIDVNLGDDCSLIITFKNGEKLIFTTDTKIVDWHWTLKRTVKDPYIEFIVACFNKGEIEISKKLE